MFSPMSPRAVALAMVISLPGCALQPPAHTEMPRLPTQWSQGSPAPSSTQPPASLTWWRALQDGGLDELVEAAEQSSPTLAQAWARLDEARANAGAQQASQGPSLRADAQASRGTSQSANGQPQTRASANANFSWELDLFGRLRHNSAAAQQRLQGSQADAQGTRLLLQAQVADAVIAARACGAQAAVRREDVRSRTAALRLTELRQAAGQVSAMDTARSRSSLADAEVNRVGTEEQCAEGEQQLVSLTGWPVARIRQALQASTPPPPRLVHEPPAFQAGLPATVLGSHPNIVSALRAADAAWEDIGAAEAARRPSLSLTALLGPSWLRAAGSFSRSSSWSLAPAWSASLWDGGRAQAQAGAARARHAQALASLEKAVRGAVQDVENALASAEGAAQRERLAQGGAVAASQLLSASLASHQAGRMSLFELEDARRSFNNAQLTLIHAQRDRARAWVALVKATGSGVSLESALAGSPTS